MIELSYLLLDPISQLGVVSYCLEWFLMVCSISNPFGLTFHLRSLLTVSPFRRPFPPFGGWLIWSFYLIYFYSYCVLWCLLCQKPSSQGVSSSYLSIWLGYYLLDFSLSFPTLNPMDWHETKGYLSLYFQEPMFNVSGQSKVIGLPVRVLNLVINGSEGIWYYIEI